MRSPSPRGTVDQKCKLYSIYFLIIDLALHSATIIPSYSPSHSTGLPLGLTVPTGLQKKRRRHQLSHWGLVELPMIVRGGISSKLSGGLSFELAVATGLHETRGRYQWAAKTNFIQIHLFFDSKKAHMYLRCNGVGDSCMLLFVMHITKPCAP